MAERDALVDAIGWVAQAAPRTGQHPALQGVRLTAKGSKLTIYAFDYDVSHQATLEVSVEEEGEGLIPGSFLRDVVASMRGEGVELVLDGKQFTASAGRSTYRVQVLDVADYPRLPKFPKAIGKLPAEELLRLVTSVAHACDDQNAAESVRGIHVEGTPSGLEMVATDRFTLASAAATWKGGDLMLTLPGRSATGAIKGLSGEVTVGHTDGLVGFKDAARAITMRCFAGDYVKWRALMRAQDADAFSLEVDAEDLVDAVKRAGKLVDDGRAIVISARSGELEISVEGEEAGNGSEILDVDCKDEMTVRMGARRFAESVVAANATAVRLGFLAPNKPVTIRPAHDESSAELLVMPRHKVGD